MYCGNCGQPMPDYKDDKMYVSTVTPADEYAKQPATAAGTEFPDAPVCGFGEVGTLTPKPPLEIDLDRWFKQIKTLVFGKAKAKGYADNTEGDGRELLDFVNKHCAGHTEGEIIYKVIRWGKKRDPEDLLKVAAWAFLAWDQHRRQNEGKLEVGYAQGIPDAAGGEGWGNDLPVVKDIRNLLQSWRLSPDDAETISKIAYERVRGGHPPYEPRKR